MSSIGIASFGVHIPRLRLARSAIALAHKWAFPNLQASARGERAVANFDEDSITMGVAAASHCAGDVDKDTSIKHLQFASTTLPFIDRLNSGIIRSALGLGQSVYATDVTGSQRAGTSALIQALQVGVTENGDALVIAADKPLTKPASAFEMQMGDGAASLVISQNNPIATVLGTISVADDFVDHYRSEANKFDYVLEERWSREAGYLKIIPSTVTFLLSKVNLTPKEIDHFVFGGLQENLAKRVAKACGFHEQIVTKALADQCGYCGCAHALIKLCATLEIAEPGERILLIGFGQGCDAILFETTENIASSRTCHGTSMALASGREDHNYLRFLAFNRLLDLDLGIRAERDYRTSQSAYYRSREIITGFTGGRCTDCQTLQFPKTSICVNPQCHRFDTQTDETFRKKIGMVKSFTEDWLTLSYSPPLMYGNVQFSDHAVLPIEFTDFDPGELRVGVEIRPVFRIKDFDHSRSFRRYFWKAKPAS